VLKLKTELELVRAGSQTEGGNYVDDFDFTCRYNARYDGTTVA
jgi:hypothetical protein